MQITTGPRLLKLKEVFKKAATEILNKDKLLNLDKNKDSFYSSNDSYITNNESVIDDLISNLRSKFSFIFKEKLISFNLEYLLNKLDDDIKNHRVNVRDIKDEKYIKEIFESSIADKKEVTLDLIEMEIKSIKEEINEIEEKTIKMKTEILEIENENKKYEEIYNEIFEN